MMTGTEDFGFDPKNYPREYRVMKELRYAFMAEAIVLVFFGVVFTIGYLVKFGLGFFQQPEVFWLLGLVLGVCMFFPGYGIVLTLHPDAIEYRRFFYHWRIPRNRIVGTRWLRPSGKGQSRIVLICDDGSTRSFLPILAADEYFDAWMKSLPVHSCLGYSKADGSMKMIKTYENGDMAYSWDASNHMWNPD